MDCVVETSASSYPPLQEVHVEIGQSYEVVVIYWYNGRAGEFHVPRMLPKQMSDFLQKFMEYKPRDEDTFGKSDKDNDGDFRWTGSADQKRACIQAATKDILSCVSQIIMKRKVLSTSYAEWYIGRKANQSISTYSQWITRQAAELIRDAEFCPMASPFELIEFGE